MKLKSNSWYSWYYKQFYNTDELPQSLCTFFWKELLAFILFPFIWPIVVIWNIKDGDTYPTVAGFCLYLLSLLGGSIIVLHFKIHNWWVILWMSFPGAIIAIIFIGGGVLAGYIIHMIYNYLRSKFLKWRYNIPIKEKKENIIKVMVKAFFGKYCPKIEWIN